MIFFCFPVFSQEKALNEILNSKASTKIKLQLFDNFYLTNTNYLYDTTTANWLLTQGEYEKVLSISKKMLLHSKSSNIPESTKQEYTFFIAKSYRKTTNYFKAITFFNNAIAINNQNNIAIKSYYNLGHCYLKISDFQKALSYFKTTSFLLKNNHKNDQLLLKALINIANIKLLNLKNEDINSRTYSCKLADSLASKISTPYQYKFIIKILLGTFYNRHKSLDIQKSKKYYDQALKIARQNKDTKRITKTYLWLGNLYNTHDFNKSRSYLNKALFYCRKDDSLNLRQIHYFFSITEARAKKFDKSILSSNKSFRYLLGENLTYNNPSNRTLIINSNKKRILLEMLPTLAEIYLNYYKFSKNTTHLNKALYYFKLADFTVDLLKINSNEFISRLYWRKLSSEIYCKAINVCFIQNNTKDALFFMEKNKALLLMEDIANRKFKHSLQIPKKQILKETKLKLQLNNLIEQIKNHPKKDSLIKLKIDIKNKLTTFHNRIYPKKTNKNPSIISAKKIQENLKQNEIFIEYHVSTDNGYGIYTNDDNGFVIAITKEKIIFEKIENLSILKDKVLTIINASKNAFKTNEDFIAFYKTSNYCFNQLFSPKIIQILKKHQKITIAPDNFLSFLPFEMLVTQKNSNTYLIHTATISYLYSYSLLKTNKTILNNHITTSFAPITFKYSNLTDLPNSKEELTNLKKYFNSSTLTNTEATKENFLKLLPKSNIIHLATHANSQDSINPWIAFNDKKLALNEIYTTENNASLIVLSGCNTTIGKDEIGEGVMSLARGFFYSGSQSVLSSLWAVDDKATPYIMNAFYKNLNDGYTKAEALRNAKLTYLNKNTLSELSPHFWASFILLGEDNSIKQKQYNWLIYIRFIVVFFILFLFFKKFRVRK